MGIYGEDGLYIQDESEFLIDRAIEHAETMHNAGIVLNREQREWLLCLGINPDTMQDDEYLADEVSLPSAGIEEE